MNGQALITNCAVKARKTENRPAPHKAIKRTPMRDVIALLIQNPSYAELVPDLASVRHLMIPGLDTFSEVLEKCRQYPHITTGQLLEHWRDSKMRHFCLVWQVGKFPLSKTIKKNYF